MRGHPAHAQSDPDAARILRCRARISFGDVSLRGAASTGHRSLKLRAFARHVQDRRASGSRVLQCPPFCVRDPFATVLAEQSQRDGGFDREVVVSDCGVMGQKAPCPGCDTGLASCRVGIRGRFPCQAEGGKIRPGTWNLALGQKLQGPNAKQTHHDMRCRKHDAAPRGPDPHSDPRSSFTQVAPTLSTGETPASAQAEARRIRWQLATASATRASRSGASERKAISARTVHSLLSRMRRSRASPPPATSCRRTTVKRSK